MGRPNRLLTEQEAAPERIAEPSSESLSPRLRQTLDCLLEGHSEKEIADRLGLSATTIHQYVTALYRHFGVQSRAQLMAQAIGLGRCRACGR
jgi:DNA-binding NarL/FixJ family response regulator